MTHERKDSPLVSVTMIFEFVSELMKTKGIELFIDTLSEDLDQYPTVVCTIYLDGKYITNGSGKGLGFGSLASAIYEAFEHLADEPFYFIEIDKQWEKRNITYHKKAYIEMQKTLCSSAQFNVFIDTPAKEVIPCLELTDYTDPSEKILVPLFFLTPSYPYSSANDKIVKKSVYDDLNLKLKKDRISNYHEYKNAMKYSSSNGGACGFSFDETFLHGLNELIERDAISLFLIDYTLNNRKERYRRINEKNLNSTNQNIIEVLNSKFNTDLVILDISADLGPWTISVYDCSRRYEKYFHVSGSGSSLSFNYAVERALLELKQMIELMTVFPDTDEGELIKSILDSSPFKFHKTAYTFDPSEFKNNDYLPFIDSSNDMLFENEPKKQIEVIMGKLREQNISVYYWKENLFNTDLMKIKLYSPQLENLSYPEHIKLPGKRGTEKLVK